MNKLNIGDLFVHKSYPKTCGIVISNEIIDGTFIKVYIKYRNELCFRVTEVGINTLLLYYDIYKVKIKNE